jgi:hypothetical protein
MPLRIAQLAIIKRYKACCVCKIMPITPFCLQVCVYQPIRVAYGVEKAIIALRTLGNDCVNGMNTKRTPINR